MTNTGEGRLEIGKIELAFSVPADANEILTTTGHHLRERSPQRQDFTIGRFAKSSMIGRPDFDATLLSALANTASVSPTQRLLRARGMERQQRAVRGTTALHHWRDRWRRSALRRRSRSGTR